MANDDRPSPFRDAFEGGLADGGAHHLAWWVEDWSAWERAASDAGWEPTTYGDGGGFASFAYYDLGGPLIAEVMELNDTTRWMMDTVRAAHVDWDGTDPLRALY